MEKFKKEIIRIKKEYEKDKNMSKEEAVEKVLVMAAEHKKVISYNKAEIELENS